MEQVFCNVYDLSPDSIGEFDLVFMDPPWPEPTPSMEADLAHLDRLLAPGGEVVVSRRQGDDAPAIPLTWGVATDRRYGDTRIFRYEKESV